MKKQKSLAADKEEGIQEPEIVAPAAEHRADPTYAQTEKDFAKEHHLSKSYARKILAGELTLDGVREKIRLQNQPVKNQGLKYLLKHLREQTPFIFACYRGDIQGTIKKVRKYDLHVLEPKAAEDRRVKKLDIKYLYKAEFAEDILDLMKIKPALAKEKLPPVLEPEQRFAVDRPQLEACLAQRKPVKVTLRGGEIFSGTLRWVSDHESKLELDETRSIVFFHHALYDFAVVAAKGPTRRA